MNILHSCLCTLTYSVHVINIHIFILYTTCNSSYTHTHYLQHTCTHHVFFHMNMYSCIFRFTHNTPHSIGLLEVYMYSSIPPPFQVPVCTTFMSCTYMVHTCTHMYTCMSCMYNMTCVCILYTHTCVPVYLPVLCT